MLLEHIFKLNAAQTTIGRELIAGFTTWMTMVYIVAVNPFMLAEAGMDFGAVFVATCLAAAFSSLVMGLYANLPIALAPGMGLNAFFVYSMVKGAGFSWEQALGAVFWSGVFCVILSISPVRKMIIGALPKSLKTGMAIGIGLFLAVIGLNNAGIIVKGQGTLVQIGDVHSIPVVLTALGFIISAALHSKGKIYAVIGGIFFVAVVAWIIDPKAAVSWNIFSLPPSIAPTFGKLDIFAPISVVFITMVSSLVFVDLFDTTGTLISVAKKTNLHEANGGVPNVEKALTADCSASVLGAVLGTSSTTSYIESNAGIVAGGRTGLTAVTVAFLFLLTTFMAPLVKMLPTYSTACALIFVAIILIGTLSDFNEWEDFSESAPLVITAIMMPLTFSIADGIAAGCIVYTLIKLISGQWKKISPTIGALSVAFIFRFAFLM